MAKEHLLSSYRPRLVNAREAIASGQIEITKNGTVFFLPSEADKKELGQRIAVAPHDQYSLMEATMFGLNEALAHAERGGFLRDRFEKEFERFIEQSDDESGLANYGLYAYYPLTKELVQFPECEWYQLALVASNSRLLQDHELKMSWEQVREIHSKINVGIAGASVGGNIAIATNMVLGNENMEIGDPNVFKTTNFNRAVRLDFRSAVYSKEWREKHPSAFGSQNKAWSLAMQINESNPFVRVYVHPEGIDEKNVGQFVHDNDIIFDEADVPEAKKGIREECRNQGKRYVVVSDEGSQIQVDTRPFDKNRNIPLSSFVSDEQLEEITRKVRTRETGFTDFVEALIGKDYKHASEFEKTLKGTLPRVVASVPQLGSTALMAAGIAAEMVARMALGFEDFPESFTIDMRRLEVRKFGKLLSEF